MFGLRALGALPYTGRPETAVTGALSRYLDSLSSANAYFATIPTVTFSGDFEIKIIAAQLNSPTFLFAGSGVAGQNGLDLYRNNSGNYQLFINASSAIGTTTAVTNTITAPDTVIVKRISGVVDLIINGVSRGTFSTSATLSVERLFHRNGWGSYGRMGLYEFTIVSGGSYNTSWNINNSPSVGNVWLSSNGQALSLSAGWPTDNSQWKQYLDTTITNALVPQPVSGAVKWYLNNTTSVSAIVRIPDIIVGATVGDYIEFKAVASAGNPSNAYRMMGASNNNWTDLIELNPSAIFFRAGGNNSSISTAAGYTQPALGIIFTFKAVKASSSTWQIFLNGSPVGSPLANGGSITVGSLFAVQGPTTIESFRGGVYYVAFSTNGGVSATRYYDPSVGNGGSTTLIDTIGGQHGTYTGDWATGTRYMPYLDTTVSTPLVNQGVNGVAKSGLDFAGNTTTLQRRIAPFPLPTDYTQDMRIDVTFVHAASGGYQAMLQTPEFSTNDNNFFVGCAPSGVFYFWCNYSQLDSNVTPIAGQEYVISITIDTAKNVGISVNGSAYLYKSYPNLSATGYSQILCGGTTNNAGSFRDPFLGRLKRVETWVGGVKTGDYTNETGAGTTMVNAIGGGLATQAGTWPTDNSEWRQYIENAVSAVTAKVIKWFNGSAWVSKPIKWFNGTAWVQKTFKR